MKKMFSMVMSLIMLIGIVSIMPAAAYADTARELPIIDPGFESTSDGAGLIANGWQSWPGNNAINNGNVSIEKNSDNPVNVYNGCHSLKVTSPSGTNGSVSAYYTLRNLKPNTSYTVGAWTKSSGWEHASLIVKDYDDGQNAGSQTEKKIVNTEFTYKTVEFTTGENNTTANILCQANWEGWTGWFDDFSVAETSTLKTKNLIKNPGFEWGDEGSWQKRSAKEGVVIKRNAEKNIYSHSGEYCLKYGVGNVPYEQDITGLKPNTMYTLSFWVKADTTEFGAGVKNFATDENNKDISLSASTTNTNEYEKKTINFKTGANKTSAVVYVYSWDQTGWADDFELYETTYLNKVTLTDNAGEEKSVPTEGTNKITATVANPGSAELKARVIAAYYNSNNVLEQVTASEEITVAEGGEPMSADLTLENLPNDAAQGKIRVFLFDGFDSLKPLDNSVVFGTQN